MAFNSDFHQQDTTRCPLMSGETKIFLIGQASSLIMTAKKLRLEAAKAPNISGELGDRAAEILCVVSNLLTMLAQATREEVEALEEVLAEVAMESSESEDSGTISPFELETCM